MINLIRYKRYVPHQKVEDAADISREETHGMRELGTDPKSGKPVSVRFGRYGAFAQI
jgi:DNA topoisomerase-1